MHPYKNLPAERFWKRAVSAQLWSEIDFRSASRFRLASHHRIATAGSCFAGHIARHLDEFGLHHCVIETAPEFMSPERAQQLQYGSFSARYGNIYTVRQLRQLIESAFGVRDDLTLSAREADGWIDLLRPGVQAEGYESLADLESDRAWHLQCVRRLFLEVDCFIFTLGLTEAWYHAPSGSVFPVCPGTMAGRFDPAEHHFVNFRFAEIVEDLHWCISFISQHNAQLKWIFTVSPVALAATATARHVVVATAASKAILRAAVDEVCQAHAHCDYFPSLEIVSSAATFGQFLDADLRNIAPRGVRLVMQNFRQAYAEAGSAPRMAPAPSVDGDIQLQLAQAARRACDESFHDPAA